MRKIHYSWFVCAGCAILLFCTSGLLINAFTVYQPYILHQNNFTNAQSSSIITVRSLFAFAAMLFAGKYYKIFSLRTGIAISGAVTVCGFVMFGLASNYFTYCFAAAAVGAGYGLGTMIPVAIVLEHWFARKRNFALGICSAATGLATLGIPSILTWLIENYGLRQAFFTESACIVLLIATTVFLIRDYPSQLGMKPYGYNESSGGSGANNSDQPEDEIYVSSPQESREGRKDKEVSMLTRKHWILIVFILLLIGPVTNVGYSHLSVLVSAEGFSPHITALAITVSGVMMTIGKFMFGLMSDKIGTYRCNWIFGGILISGLVLCCVIKDNVFLMFAAMCCYGSGLAATTVGVTAWAGDLSAPHQYDDNIRRFQLGYSAGTLIFSPLPGTLADLFNGSYIPAYILFAGFAVFVILSVQKLYRATGNARK